MKKTPQRLGIKSTRTYTVTLDEDEFQGVMDLIGKTSHEERVRMGVPSIQSFKLTDLFIFLNEKVKDYNGE